MMREKFDSQFDGQKIVYHPDWIRRWRDDPFSVPPIYIEVSPIGLCNHRCTFCAKEVIGYPNRRLSADLLIEFVTELRHIKKRDPDELGVRSLMFAGEGEPTLHAELWKVIKAAFENDIEAALTTNATGLTEKFSIRSLGHLSWIKASINAGTRETYSLVHQTPREHWDRVWSNMAKAIELRAKHGHSCEIGCQTV